MDLLRQLAGAFPARFQDLMKLTDADPELDFFNNVAHLQLHRRSRAFYRLKKVRCDCVISSSLLLVLRGAPRRSFEILPVPVCSDLP